MIGPRTKQMPDKLVCTDCDALISRTAKGTVKFPEIWEVNYCKHSELDTAVAFIKGFPYTPKWCPALKGRNLTSKCSGRDKAEVFRQPKVKTLNEAMRKTSL